METTKISVKERFAYGCGDLGCNIILLIILLHRLCKSKRIDNWNDHADLQII